MAEGQDSSQERTEQATPKRRQEAQRKGQVARSRELNTASVLIVSAFSLMLLGSWMLGGVTEVMRSRFASAGAIGYGPQDLLALLQSDLMAALRAVAPFLLLTAIAASVAPLALGGWSFNPGAVGFKWEKLDPVKGLQRIFSWHGLSELLKALAKFTLVTGVTITLLWTLADQLFVASLMSFQGALSQVGGHVMWAFVLLCAATLLIAAVDVPFQLWDHGRKLRMTRQEVKDEHKDTEGKPEVRSRIRMLQREIAQRRMMEQVPQADVVIVNPTHFAVAIKYDAERMRAPRLVAKGADRIAAEIVRRASTYDVVVLRSPMLARSLYHHARLDQEIPAALYMAVARVLAYVYRLRELGDGELVAEPPEDLPIPEELRVPGA